MSSGYRLLPSAICEKEGMMYLHQEEKKNLKKFYCVIRENIFTYGNAQKDGTVEGSICILGGAVRMMETKLLDKIGIEIAVVPNISNTCSMTATDIKAHPNRVRYCFYMDSADDASSWISILMRCTLPFEFLKESEYNGSDEHILVASSFPKVKEMAAPYRRALLWNKLRLCALHFDFSREDEAVHRDVKQAVLLELLDIVDCLPLLLNDTCIFQELIQTLELSLFRPQPTEADIVITTTGEDDEVMYVDPEWPHISLSYEILIHLILSAQIDSSIRKHAITNSFVIGLISLFDSIDSRERDYLKTATHRIYGKLTNRRAAIRKAINNAFFEFMYEKAIHHGISELLEILASIINGFTVPIRSEHIESLRKSLIPLHKMRQYEDYSAHLSYCMTLYLSKDRSLSEPIICGLLRYWPHGNSSKEMLFLNELEDLLGILRPEDIERYRIPLFRRLNKCIGSANNQVAERTLFLWSTTAFEGLVMKNMDNLHIMVPIMYSNLKQCSEDHTNVSVRQMAQHIMGMLVDWDFSMMEKLATEYESS